MFYGIIKQVWPLFAFWPPRWYVLSSDVFKRQIDLQLLLFYVVEKKSVARVKCIWQSADIKHEQMYEQNLFFPFVRLNLYSWRVELLMILLSLSVGMGENEKGRWVGRERKSCSFFSLISFSLRSKEIILIVCWKFVS